jgi:molybdenum cofactor guanylyltransferase
MPNVNEEVITKLLVNRDPDKVATCFENPEEKFPEPLLTLWEPKSLPLLKTFVSRGRVSPRDFLQEHNAKTISLTNPQIFLNINSPDDLENFKNTGKH